MTNDQDSRDAVAGMLEQLAAKLRAGELDLEHADQSRGYEQVPGEGLTRKLRLTGVETVTVRTRGPAGEWESIEPPTGVDLG
jgi:hypothetical protein